MAQEVAIIDRLNWSTDFLGLGPRVKQALVPILPSNRSTQTYESCNKLGPERPFFSNVDSSRGPHGFGSALLKCNEISKNSLFLETKWHAKENDLLALRRQLQQILNTNTHRKRRKQTVQKNIEKEVHSYSWKLRGHTVVHVVTLVSVEHCSRAGGCQQKPLVILSGLSYEGCMESY